MLVSNNLYNGVHAPDPTAKAALDNIERQERLRGKAAKPPVKDVKTSKGGEVMTWKNGS